jgi:flavin reductase (DIM6/NTAB) family NADH-FMN oxidoreductase RutF
MGPLDDLVRRADSAMVVVTVGSPDGLFGCLVGFHTQVSLEPLRYAVCLSDENATFRAAADVTELGVHLLGRSQLGLAALFGEVSADEGVDKFEQCEWDRDGVGPPILRAVLAWFVGTIIDRVPLGDHTAHILEPSRCGRGPDEPPLRYHATSGFEAGHPLNDD